MSEVHLRRVCLAETGRSPAAQLATTSQTVEAIALSVGYGSLASFSAAFQQVHRVRPSQFRVSALPD